MIQGRAHVFGHHLNTDVIHPPEYFSLDAERVRQGLMKGVDAHFLMRFSPGDILVAGENFACGSSRETSIYSMLHNRVGAVVSISFSRIFFRSAVNNGLPLFEFADSGDYGKIANGSTVAIDSERGVLLHGPDCLVLRSVPANLSRWFENGMGIQALGGA